MIEISVKIGDTWIDRVTVISTPGTLFGQTVYVVTSERNKTFHILHTPRTGLAVLISKVFDHLSIVDRWTDTPTTEEEM